MSTPSGRNIIELRQLLVDKFPGVRMSAGRGESLAKRWPTGVPQIDALLQGGLAIAALTEIVTSGVASGSALLLGAFIQKARQNGQWIALIDGGDSFDPAGLQNSELSRLLWVRCSAAKEAIKAVDLLLHDRTISIILLDLIRCPLASLRKIPSSTWFRFERTIEGTSTACVIFTPEPMISVAETRLVLEPRFTLNSIDADRETLRAQISARPAELSAGSRRIVRSA